MLVKLAPPSIERYTSDKIPTRTPENALRVFVAELKDGKVIGYRDLGYVTEPRGLVGEQSINKIIIEPIIIYKYCFPILIVISKWTHFTEQKRIKLL